MNEDISKCCVQKEYMFIRVRIWYFLNQNRYISYINFSIMLHIAYFDIFSHFKGVLKSNIGQFKKLLCVFLKFMSDDVFTQTYRPRVCNSNRRLGQWCLKIYIFFLYKILKSWIILHKLSNGLNFLNLQKLSYVKFLVNSWFHLSMKQKILTL